MLSETGERILQDLNKIQQKFNDFDDKDLALRDLIEVVKRIVVQVEQVRE